MQPTQEEFENWTDKMIADKYDCSVRTVQRWRSRLRIKRDGWGPGKLDYEKAREIRHIYNQRKMTQEALARLYGVSQAAIGRVVNNISYPEKAVGLSGESLCVVDYRVD